MRICSKNDLKAKKRLLCFDLDGTLTQHRSKLEDENKKVLDELKVKEALDRIIEEANYIIRTGDTVRGTAKVFHFSIFPNYACSFSVFNTP